MFPAVVELLPRIPLARIVCSGSQRVPLAGVMSVAWYPSAIYCHAQLIVPETPPDTNDPLITPPENVSATSATWIVAAVAAVLASCMIQNTSLSPGREGAAYTLGRFTPTTVGADSILCSGRAPMMGRTDPVFMRRPLVGCILN